MTEKVLPLPPRFSESLFDVIWKSHFDCPDDVRVGRRHLFGHHNGIKVELFSNEHPPPHFRVTFHGSTANYSIKDCSRLNGHGDVLREERNIRKWWAMHKADLIQFWNDKRPEHCSVGKYKE